MLRIGPLTLRTPLLLAPIAGYCDLAFRLVVRSVPGVPCEPHDRGAPRDAGDGTYGAVGLASTDLLCPQALLQESDKALWLAATNEHDRPLCMQLYGADPAILADAARWALDHGAALIDINMGCPVDKVTKRNGGSKLLCDPRDAVGIAAAVVHAVAGAVPVTAKIRLGWDDRSIITRTIPPALGDAGIAALTVHGRTTEQMFRGQARLTSTADDSIAAVVETMARHHPTVPVIGNGDVKCPADAQRMIRLTGCAGVMIGRGALGQPWVFRDTAHLLATGRDAPPFPRAARAQLVLDHFHHLLCLRGQRIALNTIRQRISWYSPHLQPWPHLKRDVQALTTAAALSDFLAAGVQRLRTEDAATPSLAI